MQFPTWLHEVFNGDHVPERFKEKFAKGFDKKRTPDELIDLFGRANQVPIGNLLGKQALKKFKKRLDQQQKTFEQITQIALKSWSENGYLSKSILTQVNNEIFHQKFLSTEDPSQTIKIFVIKYLLSVSMPSQEMRRLGYHRIKEIRETIDATQAELDGAVSKLFRIALGNDEDRKQTTITLREEQLLFKNALLKVSNKTATWGKLFFLWLSCSQKGDQIIKTMPRFNFHHLLEKISFSDKKRDISFPDYLFEFGLLFLFRHAHSLFPAGVAEQRLLEVADGSFSIMQDITFFIDYLHKLCVPSKDFPIEEALKILRSFVPDHSSDLFLVLCQCVHFLNCKFLLSPSKEEEPKLFETLLTWDCNKIIREKFYREPICISDLLNLKTEKKLSLHDCALIVVKFASTLSDSKESSYLSMRQHLEALQLIETNLGIALPADIIADFLLFQTARKLNKNSLFRDLTFPINAFSQLSFQVARDSRRRIAIPEEIYGEWIRQSSELLDSIDTNVRDLPSYLRERAANYPVKMMKFIRLVQFAAYPLPLIASIREMIPINLKERELIFSQLGNHQLNCWFPLLSDFPTGIGMTCHWISVPENTYGGLLAKRDFREDSSALDASCNFAAETNLSARSCNAADGVLLSTRKSFFASKPPFAFSISLTTSQNEPERHQTFLVYLELPKSEAHYQPYFALLSTFIDVLGSEDLKEEDIDRLTEILSYKMSELEFKEIISNAIPSHVLNSDAHPSYLFDQLIGRNSLLKKIWEIAEPDFGPDADEIKSFIYKFVLSYRSQFKKCFYLLLSPGWLNAMQKEPKTKVESLNLSALKEQISQIFDPSDIEAFFGNESMHSNSDEQFFSSLESQISQFFDPDNRLEEPVPPDQKTGSGCSMSEECEYVFDSVDEGSFAHSNN